MEILQGKSVFREICFGPLFFYDAGAGEIVRRPVLSKKEEMERFFDARKQAADELEALYQTSRESVGENNATIFQIQALLLEDEKYETSVRQMVEQLGMNVEYAVRVTGDNTASMLHSVQDPYIRERAQDVRDITNRLLHALTGEGKSERFPNTPFILVADDLLPSETMMFARKNVIGICLRHGSLHSHTAILARSIGIPALVDLGETLDRHLDGKDAIVDGFSGKLYLEPEEGIREELLRKKESTERHKLLLQHLRGKEDVTKSGQRMKVYANAANLEDVALAIANDATGIGLFRSEMQYLESPEAPTEEALFSLYRSVLETMQGKEVIIRTFDIGADKQAPWMELAKEENPALGVRGARLGLKRPELLKAQLRALFRASVYGNLAIMYPMIVSVGEVEQLRTMEADAKEQLKAEDIPFAERVPVGIMIETPAAALLSESLAKKVDFFSVGTNDLTQYTLAIDRQNAAAQEFDDPSHEAVLKLVRMAAKSAHKAGIPIGICGDLASAPALTQEFVKMGIDELSVPAGLVLEMREKVRACK